MQARSIVAIQAVVHADLAKGSMIDIDAYCRAFAPRYPDLTRKQIQDTILEIVSIAGGAAVWGTDDGPQASGTGS